ncbi:MAG: hypothetical protein U0S36_01445 [Candidatus Nanopelagicales bacterium]
MRRPTRLAGAAVALSLAVTCLAVTGTAAEAGEPVYTARLTPLPALRSPTSMAVAGGRLVVTDGDAVVVLSTAGTQLARITGIGLAADATAAPDGSVVLVTAAGSDEIVEIDPSTATVVRRYPVAPCPHELAVTATTIWYTYGCSAGSGGINHVSRIDGTVHDIGSPDAGPAYRTAHLGAGGGRLFAYESALTSWTTDGDVLGPPNLNETDGGPDGDVVVSNGHVVLLNAPTAEAYGAKVLGHDLVLQRTVATAGGPEAGAISRDGQRLVLGTTDERTAVLVVDSATGARINAARMPIGSTNVPTILGGCLGLSADGSVAYAIAGEFEDGAMRYFLAASTVDAPSPTPVKVTVAGPVTLGSSAVITVRTSAYRQVTLTMTTRLGTSSGTFTADGAGVLRVAARMSFSGSVTARVEGDLTHTDGSGARKFEVPSSIRAVVNKGYKKRKGITYYRSFAAAVQAAAVLPAIPDRPVSATLYVKRGSHWSRRNTWTTRTDRRGVVVSRVYGNLRGRVMKVMYNFAGDDDNGGSTAWTAPFVVK